MHPTHAADEMRVETVGVCKSVEGGMVQGVSTHPVVDQSVNAPAELAQLGVDAVEDGVLQVEDAV